MGEGGVKRNTAGSTRTARAVTAERANEATKGAVQPYLDDVDVRLFNGDALEVLREMESESVDCCVTSPPYWGLRDYGTGTWEGGDAECDHARQSAVSRASSGLGVKNGLGPYGDYAATQGGTIAYLDLCGKCGARRVDRQLGLEPTPEEYVARLVTVFEEVRRVLSKSGTLWLNLGSSYASDPAKGGSGPNGKNEARSRRDARSSDTTCTEPQGSIVPDSACPDLCDACAAALETRTARTSQPLDESAQRASLTARDSEPADSLPRPPGASPPVAPVSTTPQSSQPLPGACSHCPNCGACLDVLRSSSRDARLCAHNSESRNGTSLLESGDRNQGTDAEGMAWLNYTSQLKQKDMVPIPWMVAMALQAAGWYLRSDIIWSKPNPMPESVTDRPTKAHEYVFLLTKSPRYFYDQESLREPHQDKAGGPERFGAIGSNGGYVESERTRLGGVRSTAVAKGNRREYHPAGRNSRSVWEIATEPYPDAHFATFPTELARRCILGGCPEAGTVLDPFAGSGTVGFVARKLSRRAVLIELNENYCKLASKRLSQLSLLA